MQKLVEQWKEICEKAPELDEDAIHLAFIEGGEFLTTEGKSHTGESVDMWKNTVREVYYIRQWCFGNVPSYLALPKRGSMYPKMALHIDIRECRESKILWELLKDAPHMMYPKTYEQYLEGYFIFEGNVFASCGVGALLRLPTTFLEAIEDQWVDEKEGEVPLTMDSALFQETRHNPLQALKLSSWDELENRVVDWESLERVVSNFGIYTQHCATLPLTPYACCLYACSVKLKGKK